MSAVVDTVKDMVMPILEENNYELVDLEFVKEGKSWYLRVFIDKEDGIDIEECAYVSERLSEKLDNAEPDPIPQAYFLEVSSPGAERPLKNEEDYQKAVGNYIHVSLYEPIDNQKQYDGFLQSVDTNQIVLKIRIKTREKEITIDRKKIAKAHLAVQI
ncbi:ribosome maturation factor RimP [Tetragenococcus muriaticus]|uniref:Ribosome maturation factor RimP n=1 Tax=Tetragenococcus muriaticus 3MR10-3 TaxID=1302648 RepID=A0A091C0C1_9ENTE|nr:ribosome maturation factor RimP [Tetragenococcus muriaticus]KFN91296.1 hypothetical protein TMU3MR103_1083 [Tetragenococcus muriaticus 3MR10-3]GMA47270.1 ribosome maturation factor RimP [Tetragenococcus muriaticus]GMA48563.1 ribosome maturation factor RimP [Tetragenococcus muriaticus]GMA48603.1 ribosome maturation factor RimP [Tetragenococcus muriaticus]